MAWRTRIAVLVSLTVLLLAGAAAVGVVRGWYGGDCWPWEDRQDAGGVTLCEGSVHPHSR